MVCEIELEIQYIIQKKFICSYKLLRTFCIMGQQLNYISKLNLIKIGVVKASFKKTIKLI